MLVRLSIGLAFASPRSVTPLTQIRNAIPFKNPRSQQTDPGSHPLRARGVAVYRPSSSLLPSLPSSYPSPPCPLSPALPPPANCLNIPTFLRRAGQLLAGRGRGGVCGRAVVPLLLILFPLRFYPAYNADLRAVNKCTRILTSRTRKENCDT